MCGIVAIIGNIQPVDEKIFRTLLVLDTLRGEDSTGMLSVSKYTGETRIAKQVGDPFQLFDTKQYENAMRQTHRVLLGHNRYGTSGGINKANAHPFEHDNLIGVHNGTLKNKHNLLDASKFKVDSDNLYHHIEKRGLADALDKADGAWALCWWNREEETFNILRNNERPLWVAMSQNAKGELDNEKLYVASEPWMLRVALSRHNQACGTPEEIDKDLHFKIPVTNGGKIGKPILKAAPGTYKPAYQGNFSNGGMNTHGNNVISLNKKETTNPEVKKPVSGVNGSYESQFDRFYLRAKSRLFELLSVSTDTSGMEYIVLFDAQHQFKEVRLYPRRDDETIWEMIGCEVHADISVWVPSDSHPGKGYYKVVVDSVRVIAPTPEENTPEHVVAGPTGRIITQETFKRLYPDCAYCSSPLEFGDRNKFSLSGECFCPSCAVLPDVTDMVKF